MMLSRFSFFFVKFILIKQQHEFLKGDEGDKKRVTSLKDSTAQAARKEKCKVLGPRLAPPVLVPSHQVVVIKKRARKVQLLFKCFML